MANVMCPTTWWPVLDDHGYRMIRNVVTSLHLTGSLGSASRYCHPKLLHYCRYTVSHKSSHLYTLHNFVKF